jgi:hypothetical protein
MKPDEFSWTEDQQVTVTNPTAEPFHFKVHNKEYMVGAGKTARMPGYIAWVYVYNMASQLCQTDKRFDRWNDDGFRQQYYDKVVAGIEQLFQTVEDEPTPKVQSFDIDDNVSLDVADKPAPGTGGNYEVKHRGRPAKI